MAEISKLSKVAIADVAKVDAVLKADIANFNGLTIPSAAGLLLDTYTGAAAAYSVRRLRTAYTGAIMRVRRDSDNVEANVGFDSNNELSLTSPISNTSDSQTYTDFADFVDHTGTPANGFVRKWYDQASSNDTGQTTATNQPKIYDSSTGLIEKGSVGNEKPALNFDDDAIVLSGASGISGLAQSFFFVADAAKNGFDECFLGAGRQVTGESRSFTSEYYMRFVSSTQNYTGYAETNVRRLHSIVCPGTISNISAYDWYRDGSLLTPTTASTTAVNSISGTVVINIGSNSSGGTVFEGHIQEVIVWNSDQSSNRTGIESNLNSYFSIF